MARPSLSHLYFESIGVSKAPLTWLLCAACIHAGLFCIPTGNYKTSEYGIVFRDGNSGIEVELTPELLESVPDQTLASPESSRDSVTPLPDPDPLRSTLLGWLLSSIFVLSLARLSRAT